MAVKSDTEAEALVADLIAEGFTLKVSLEQHALGRLAAVRLIPQGESDEGVVIDLLFASSGIEDEICRDAERVEVTPDLVIPVARAGHLVAMKIRAVAGSATRRVGPPRVARTVVGGRSRFGEGRREADRTPPRQSRRAWHKNSSNG